MFLHHQEEGYQTIWWKKQKKLQCAICGKFHHDEYQYAKTTTKYKDTGFRGKKKQFESKLLKLMKQVTEDSDDDSSGYSTNTSWKKNITQEERLFIMGATTDVSDSDTTSLDPTKAKKLLIKKFEKKKQLLKSNKAYWLKAASGRLISDAFVVTIDSTGRGTMLKGLLDLGSTTSIVLQQHANKLTRGDKLKYSTYGGTTTTSYSTKLQLELIEFSKRISFKCQMDTSSIKSSNDIIIGSGDFLSLLGIGLSLEQTDWNQIK